MKKKVDFVFRYEHKVRELESIMLLRIELEKRGYTVDFIGNYEYDRKDYPQPRVFVAPAVYSDGQLLGDLTTFGILSKIASLQWEQLIGIKQEEDPNGFHNIKGLGQRIITFCWGQRSHDRFVNTGVMADKVPIVGQINTDLLRGDFRSLLLSKIELSEKYNLDGNKEWYLFISSFSYCDMEDSQIKICIKALGEKDFNLFTDVSFRSREIILDWFEKKLKECPDIIVIYRPHPDETEKCGRIKNMESVYPNFRVIQHESIKHWINACDKIYNWFSTGGIDAVVLEKPLRLLRPFPIPVHLDYRIMSCANQIHSHREFDIDYFNLDNKNVYDKMMFSSYYYLPERPVYMSICDILEEMLNSDKYNTVYTKSEKMIIMKNHYWGLVMRPFKSLFLKIPSKYLFGALKERKKKKLDSIAVLKRGYDKNVASPKDINEIKERLLPIIYRQ